MGVFGRFYRPNADGARDREPPDSGRFRRGPLDGYSAADLRQRWRAEHDHTELAAVWAGSPGAVYPGENHAIAWPEQMRPIVEDEFNAAGEDHIEINGVGVMVGLR
jgi:hypothetical protein